MATTTLLGVAEVATLLQVKPQTVSQWRHRNLFPDPDVTTARADLWERSTVERWARTTGRWPHD